MHACFFLLLFWFFPFPFPFDFPSFFFSFFLFFPSFLLFLSLSPFLPLSLLPSSLLSYLTLLDATLSRLSCPSSRTKGGEFPGESQGAPAEVTHLFSSSCSQPGGTGQAVPGTSRARAAGHRLTQPLSHRSFPLLWPRLPFNMWSLWSWMLKEGSRSISFPNPELNSWWTAVLNGGCWQCLWKEKSLAGILCGIPTPASSNLPSPLLYIKEL